MKAIHGIEKDLPVLILSDGRKGHLNQSVALAKHLGMEYQIEEIHFRCRWMKGLSYLLDRMGIYTGKLFDAPLPEGDFSMAVAAGSGTYYALKVLSSISGLRTVSMMYPRGYRPDFDVVFVQSHDAHAACGIEAIEIPVNFSYPERQWLYKPKKRAIAVVIGGPNGRLAMPVHLIRSAMDAVFDRYRDCEIALSTSPRTPAEIEELLDAYDFDYRVLYSKNPVNPIPDFLYECETVFITEDSTSMISEAVSAGKCCVEVIVLESDGSSKFSRLSTMLEMGGYLHRFDGDTECARRKVDLSSYARKALE